MKTVTKIRTKIAENGLLPTVRSFLRHRLRPQYKGTVVDMYYNLPLDENKILLLGLGKSVRGSLQYILDELNHNPSYSHFQIYVRVSAESDDIVRTFIKNSGWKQTHPVLDTKEYEYHMESAKYLLTETYFPHQWIRKDGQVVINIWHGTPLKRLGLEKMTLNKYVDGITQKNFINSDYLLYPNTFTKDTMLLSYRVSSLMHGQAVMCGYPRTSGLCSTSGSGQLRERLAPNNEMLYAYMPTWKEYLPLEEVLASSKALLDYMDAHLREDQILYVNLHHKVSDQLDYSVYRRIRKFPSDVDSYRLLAASDGLITDYSSVFFDYLASRKNIILYVPDLEDYEQRRGTYLNVRDLPFHMARRPQEVLDAMDLGKTYDDSAAYQEFCSFEHESNASVLCRIFLNDLSGITLEQLSTDTRRKILFYSDDPAENAGNNLYLSCIEAIDRERYDLYLSGYEPHIMEDRERASAALVKINKENVIGLKQPLRFSAQGNRAKETCSSNPSSLSDAMSTLKRDYQTNFRLYYGVSPFSTVIIHTVMNADLLLMLANAPCTVLVILSDQLLSDAQKDPLLLEALNYTVRSGAHIISGTESLTETAEKIIPEMKGKITPLQAPADLNRLIDSF